LQLLLSLFLAASAHAGLRVAAAKVDITPDLGKYRIYMAGFGSTGRRPAGVHDPLYARILLMSDGKKTVGVVGLDLLGFYRNDVEDLRRMAGFTAPERYLFVSSTHEHSGPDTMGLWGPFVGVSGLNKAYHKEIKKKIVAKMAELSSQLQEAELRGFSKEIDPRGLCRDSRNPAVINPNLAAFTLSTKAGKTLATVVNWSCHPEVLGAKNLLITADYPGPMCDSLEKKLGGTCVFLSGTIGGLMTPDVEEENFYESYPIGTELAGLVMKGMSQATVSSKNPALDFKSKLILVPIENSRYLLFLPALTFGHKLMDKAGNYLPRWKAYWLPLKHALVRLGDKDRPWIESEVSLLDIGPARILGIPGEIFPELVVGGYDGKFRAGHDLIDPKNPNPPDLKSAPKGPYLLDHLHAPLKLVVGLANDELGYILPEYDFKIQPSLSLLPRLPGHHYEETNSIGPSATRIITDAAASLTQ